RDGGTASDAEAAKGAWRARFTLDVEPARPVHALVSLSGDRTSVRMWAERRAARGRQGQGHDRREDHRDRQGAWHPDRGKRGAGRRAVECRTRRGNPGRTLQGGGAGPDLRAAAVGAHSLDSWFEAADAAEMGKGKARAVFQPVAKRAIDADMGKPDERD